MKHMLFAAMMMTAALVGRAEGDVDGFERVHILEEATSTGCSFCPRGIVTMAYIHDTYPDHVITVAYHMHMGDAVDPMRSETAAAFTRYYPTGLPYAIIDRKTDTRLGSYIDPVEARENIGALCESLAGDRAIAGIVLEAALTDPGSLAEATAKATVTFADDMTDSEMYQLSFLLVEDGVGPYEQDNRGYSHSVYDCDGWEARGRKPSVEHNHVVRELYGFPGIEGSVPAGMKKGESHTFTQSVSLASVEDDTETVRIVALLSDTRTREVINARAVDLQLREPAEQPEQPEQPEDPDAAINVVEGVSAPATAWYSLQGIPLDRPESGTVCIRVDGSKAVKVVVR